MMDKPVIRVALQSDKPAIQELNIRAFGKEDEARIIRQQLPGKIDQFRQIAFQLPHLAIGAAAIFGGIKDQAVIFCPAPNLAAQEFQCIIDDPAHRRIA